ncbi:MAG: glucosyl-3-phosphoglycerate synthase [Acidimicrobiales bacterium]
MTTIPPLPARRPATVSGASFDAAGLVARKGGRRVAVCLPARDEEATVGPIVAAVHRRLCVQHRLVDEIVVVDDASVDGTAAAARAAGARVVAGGGGGKGQAMQAGLAASDGDFVVYCDADVRSFSTAFVVGLLGPLLADGDVTFVKGFYDRPFDGREGEGGRVTELMAKPALRVLLPALAGFVQPLAGEYAARRDVLEQVPFVRGYGVDIALLADVAERFGLASMVQVDLGRRVHRNRPLAELGPQAEAVLRTVLSRAGVGGRVEELAPLASAPPGGLRTA